MKLQVLFDREAVKEGLNTGWGLSFILDSHILFDTGEKFEYIRDNAAALNVDLNLVDTVVISHEHWDHINGLWGILQMRKGMKVYGCPGMSKEFIDKVHEAGGTFEEAGLKTQIADRVFILGENRVIYKGKGLSEQMLVIENDTDLSLICACCHPGIVNIVHKAANVFGKKVAVVAGGMHMIDKDQRFNRYSISEMKMFVDKVYSSHCTGHDAQEILKEFYGDKADVLKTGMEIEL